MASSITQAVIAQLKADSTLLALMGSNAVSAANRIRDEISGKSALPAIAVGATTGGEATAATHGSTVQVWIKAATDTAANDILEHIGGLYKDYSGTVGAGSVTRRAVRSREVAREQPAKEGAVNAYWAQVDFVMDIVDS